MWLLNKYGLLLHGFVFMSNHFHFVVTDRRSNLPDFMRDFVALTRFMLSTVLSFASHSYLPVAKAIAVLATKISWVSRVFSEAL